MVTPEATFCTNCWLHILNARVRCKEIRLRDQTTVTDHSAFHSMLPLTWEYAHRSRKQTMESFSLPPRTVGMVPGWSVLSSGVHTPEDPRLEVQWMRTSGPDTPGSSLVDTARSCWRVSPLLSVCVTGGDRGWCRRVCNVRDDTRTHTHTHTHKHTRRSVMEITTQSDAVTVQWCIFKCAVWMLNVAETPQSCFPTDRGVAGNYMDCVHCFFLPPGGNKL